MFEREWAIVLKRGLEGTTVWDRRNNHHSPGRSSDSLGGRNDVLGFVTRRT